MESRRGKLERPGEGGKVRGHVAEGEVWSKEKGVSGRRHVTRLESIPM